ncbi:MAG: ATP-grasp domain-containing protein [Candidatus Helarchaeota archaeon]
MLVGIHKDQYGKFCSFLQKYEEILDLNKIDHIRLDASDINFWDKVKKLDLFIFRWIHIDDHHQLAKTIIPIIEKELKVNCFPNMNSCWHYDDKIRQYYLLKSHGFPMVESWIFWNKKEASRWIGNTSFPLVFKLKGGASSKNVILVKTKNQAKKLINRMFGKGILSGKVPGFDNIKYKDFNLYKIIHHLGGNVFRILRDEDISPFWQKHKNYVLFQKFLPNNYYDTRVTVIGDRAFAFRRFTRNNDFRSSGSGRIDYSKEKIDMNFIKISLEISEKMKFQSMAYDFLYDENNKPAISEISYTYMDVAVRNCPGYWDSELNWHEGHYWPQYFHLIDALGLPDLKQPEMDF